MIHSGCQRGALALLAACCLALPACESDGHFCILGYTTRPNYDCDIHTVRVPIFKSRIMEDTVRRGIEFDLTRAVVREIELKTPYKVVSGDCAADTELTGTIVGFPKQLLNRNQLNEVREAETLLTVELVWRDLRTGEILSQPRRPGPLPPPPPPGVPPPPPPPVLVQGKATFIPELGGSFITARQDDVDRLARKIVEMMEKPW
jgi:hypothetical protein